MNRRDENGAVIQPAKSAIACPKCHAPGFVPHRTKEGSRPAVWIFHLYPAKQREDGMYVPRLDQPEHPCCNKDASVKHPCPRHHAAAYLAARTRNEEHQGADDQGAPVIDEDAEFDGTDDQGADTDDQGAPERHPDFVPVPQGATGRPAPAPAVAIAQALETLMQNALDEKRVRSIVADAIKDTPTAIDETAVRAIVEEALARPKVTRLEIIREGAPVKVVEGAHKQYHKLLALVNTKKPVLLFGKPGASKTHSAMMAADELGVPFDFISLNQQTPESRVFGHPTADGGHNRSPFREVWENGGLYLIDEIDNAGGSLLTSLNSIDNGWISFADRKVPRHEKCYIMATANTPGFGGDKIHSERRPLPAAFKNRFLTLEWEYDLDLEDRLTARINSDVAAVWVRWVRTVRDYCETAYPALVVSPRASMDGALLLKPGMPFAIDEVAEISLFKGFDKDSKKKILAACPLPTVKAA